VSISKIRCVRPVDAMGCQKEIVKEIVRQKADYVITLKENQGNLYKDVEELLRIGMQRVSGVRI
jgi:predicted transposase YbfD/YdcC